MVERLSLKAHCNPYCKSSVRVTSDDAGLDQDLCRWQIQPLEGGFDLGKFGFGTPHQHGVVELVGHHAHVAQYCSGRCLLCSASLSGACTPVLAVPAPPARMPNPPLLGKAVLELKALPGWPKLEPVALVKPGATPELATALVWRYHRQKCRPAQWQGGGH